MIQRVEFKDGVEWIVRVPMIPTFKGVTTYKEIGRTERANFLSSIATTMYIRGNTEIPVPDVFGYDFNPENEFGAPYALLECVQGNCIRDISDEVPAEHRERFDKSLAQYQVFEQRRHYLH